jgi:hypothetical protein
MDIEKAEKNLKDGRAVGLLGQLQNSWDIFNLAAQHDIVFEELEFQKERSFTSED